MSPRSHVTESVCALTVKQRAPTVSVEDVLPVNIKTDSKHLVCAVGEDLRSVVFIWQTASDEMNSESHWL